MDGEHRSSPEGCPERLAKAECEVREAFEAAVQFCRSNDHAVFSEFEESLGSRVARLGCLLVQLFLAWRHHRLEEQSATERGACEKQKPYACRQLHTRFGKVVYGRRYLIPQGGCGGFHPLDVALGLTHDRFSPWVISFVTRLCTRLSYQGAKLVCQYAVGWSPSKESMQHLVLGLGRHAAEYMAVAPPPEKEGEVLVIEVDGKCTPTATEAELKKRRGPRCRKSCPCGCQRHRGQQKRKTRGPRKRRKKGDKSKNGREVVVVVIYTLRRGPEGKLHGPINKKVWGSYAGREAAAQWARAQATKRGFPPDTDKEIQIVIDGAKGLRQNLAREFPAAILTLDVRHAEGKLWEAGRLFHAEASEELADYVGELQELLYQGKAAEIVARLRQQWERTPSRGPGNHNRRTTLQKIINYLEPRLDLMQYGTWKEKDLVLASGQVEGACRYLVGLRMDSSGMRWIPERGQGLLHLRCLELNGDWEAFIRWAYEKYRKQLLTCQAVQIRSGKPLELEMATAA
jgi:hypothetical protein